MHEMIEGNNLQFASEGAQSVNPMLLASTNTQNEYAKFHVH